MIKRIEMASTMVENWADQAQLKLNHSKTELVCFCGCVRGNCKDKCRVTEVNIAGKVVPAVSKFKFLGVDLTNNGLIDPYVTTLLKKLNVANGRLKTMQFGATLEHKRCLFFHKNADGLSIGFGFTHNNFVENDDFNSRRF